MAELEQVKDIEKASEHDVTKLFLQLIDKKLHTKSKFRDMLKLEDGEKAILWPIPPSNKVRGYKPLIHHLIHDSGTLEQKMKRLTERVEDELKSGTYEHEKHEKIEAQIAILGLLESNVNLEEGKNKKEGTASKKLMDKLNIPGPLQEKLRESGIDLYKTIDNLQRHFKKLIGHIVNYEPWKQTKTYGEEQADKRSAEAEATASGKHATEKEPAKTEPAKDESGEAAPAAKELGLRPFVESASAPETATLAAPAEMVKPEEAVAVENVGDRVEITNVVPEVQPGNPETVAAATAAAAMEAAVPANDTMPATPPVNEKPMPSVGDLAAAKARRDQPLPPMAEAS